MTTDIKLCNTKIVNIIRNAIVDTKNNLKEEEHCCVEEKLIYFVLV